MDQTTRPTVPCAVVIFGASGDLTSRLLMPALFNMKRAGLLADGFAVVGVARRAETDDSFRAKLEDDLRKSRLDAFDHKSWDWLASRTRFLRGDAEAPETYKRLGTLLEEVDAAQGTRGNRLYYLALPPAEFAPVVRRLGEAGLTREDGGQWRRLIVEKPFGSDLESAKKLNAEMLGILSEKQIFRIDHYLGKETVQNMMVLRFGNGLFEPLWNREHIDHIQITVAETLGVEGRGKFYEATGALRDMVPNHLFQLLTLTAMEPPTCFDAEAFRTERHKVLEAIREFSPETARTDIVRGQYGQGAIDGKSFPAYVEEPAVAPDSTTETYVAMKLWIDNWRWAGVPFYLRTGKALAAKQSQILVQFMQAPLTLFHGTPVDHLVPNDMTLHIQPEEGVSLRFGAKIPGPRLRVGDVAMKFRYGDYFELPPNTGYETLLYDCMVGDASLFQRADNIEASWRIIQPVLDAWAEERDAKPHAYPAGSEGPAPANALLERDGRSWRRIAARART